MPWSSYSEIARRYYLADVIAESGSINAEDLADQRDGGVVRVTNPAAIRATRTSGSRSNATYRGLDVPMSLALGAATGCGFLPWRKR